MRQQQKNRQQVTSRPWKSPYVGVTAAFVAAFAVSGCHVDMWTQHKVLPYQQSEFFADQQASRPLVPNTVPRTGTLRSEDPAYYTGKLALPVQRPVAKPRTQGTSAGFAERSGMVIAAPPGSDEDRATLVKTIPLRAVQAFASPKDMLLRGQQRYNAYCSPCHGKTGNGNGFITQRGLGYWQKLPASYHTDRLRRIEDGHIYDVITNGYGIMYGYASRIQDVNDRWAVVAYVRALQLTRSSAPNVAPTETERTERLSNEPSAPAEASGRLPGASNRPETESVPGEPKAPAAGGMPTEEPTTANPSGLPKPEVVNPPGEANDQPARTGGTR